ncbi:MAG: ATP phosphoribosyltransferase regulatory subunit, partial [Oscillospiraceae bacterium]|nr:ATP phosphoribosyltransferase regulatory subunit [Oscillospiraceae bacterium]
MDLSLSFQEKVIFGLRSLYRSYGYTQYKMSKFEEYDLYAKNKDFLISDSVITFTDTNGKLMALKPDVTLSIIKKMKDRSDCVQKLFYNENVYRISKGNKSYKEIMQVGLECIGDIGASHILQVLTLAAKSLKSISENCVLNITNLDLLSQILDNLEASGLKTADILKCLEEKNEDGLKKLDLPENAQTVLTTLIHAAGPAQGVLPGLIDALQGLCDVSS